jgi:hypothetical protein
MRATGRRVDELSDVAPPGICRSRRRPTRTALVTFHAAGRPDLAASRRGPGPGRRRARTVALGARSPGPGRSPRTQESAQAGRSAPRDGCWMLNRAPRGAPNAYGEVSGNADQRRGGDEDHDHDQSRVRRGGRGMARGGPGTPPTGNGGSHGSPASRPGTIGPPRPSGTVMPGGQDPPSPRMCIPGGRAGPAL